MGNYRQAGPCRSKSQPAPAFEDDVLNGGGTADKKRYTRQRQRRHDPMPTMQAPAACGNSEHFLVAVHGRANGLNPLRWVVDMGGEIARTLPTKLPPASGVLFGRLTEPSRLAVSPAAHFRSYRVIAQRTGTHRQDGVVDGPVACLTLLIRSATRTAQRTGGLPDLDVEHAVWRRTAASTAARVAPRPASRRRCKVRQRIPPS